MNGRAVIDSVEDVAGRAGAYAQARMGHLSERAQHLARDANDRVEHLTGRPIESWARAARRFSRDSPRPALAAAVALGYVLGKLMTRRG
jgi:ElaB/YqjD/DUF883 family membrane-anchored ribosome-binding protein